MGESVFVSGFLKGRIVSNFEGHFGKLEYSFLWIMETLKITVTIFSIENSHNVLLGIKLDNSIIFFKTVCLIHLIS